MHLALVLAALLPLATAAVAQPVASAQNTPPWAYPKLGTAPPAPPDDGVRHQLPGSPLRLTMVELFDQFQAHDWFPELHPPMPEVVQRGRKAQDVRACGMCHLPNGQGRPENAALAGLPAAYILQQMADWKSGRRRSAEPDTGPAIRMRSTAMNVSDDDAAAAAEYFASIPYRPWIRVVETDRVPRAQVVIGSMWAALPGPEREPLGQRILEVPEDLHRTELRDPRAGFVAYVPPGSVKRGEALATSGAGKTLPCGSCHGPRLQGVGMVPPLAGRSAQYLVRQLYDFRQGTRAGLQSAPMREVAAQLSLDDMIDAAAYAASLQP